MKPSLSRLFDTTTSHTEKLVSALGGFVAIGLALAVDAYLLDLQGATLIVASMGASSVLLFAVPHGALSQPWPLVGGHLVSALVGVTCAQLVPQPIVAAALAVGIAIGAMYYLRCIHPPGGATALTAVMGGSAVHELGYQFVLAPVLINALTMLLIAVAFNYGFAWRRYPLALMAKPQPTPPPKQDVCEKAWIAHSDLVYALSEIDSFVDVEEQDLLRIYDLALKHAQSRAGLEYTAIGLGRYYYARISDYSWQVRGVIDEAASDIAPDEQIIYRVVAGLYRGETRATSRGDFGRWAQTEVHRRGEQWIRDDNGEAVG